MTASTEFRKRTFDLPLLVRSLVSAIVHLPVLRRRAAVSVHLACAAREGDARGDLGERLPLLQLRAHRPGAGPRVDLDELRQLLDRGTFGEVDERDAVAALFAQHFAETVRHPSPSARAALARQFNAYQRLEIMAYIHAIYLANLFGNTFDAWVERLSGRRVADGHPFAEAIPAILMAPFAGYFALRGRISARRAAAPIGRR